MQQLSKQCHPDVFLNARKKGRVVMWLMFGMYETRSNLDIAVCCIYNNQSSI